MAAPPPHPMQKKMPYPPSHQILIYRALYANLAAAKCGKINIPLASLPPITNEKHLIKKADAFLEHCQHRYFSEHYGITPQQILDGQVPNKEKFKEQIKAAQIQRRETNKNFTGCTTPNC